MVGVRVIYPAIYALVLVQTADLFMPTLHLLQFSLSTMNAFATLLHRKLTLCR